MDPTYIALLAITGIGIINTLYLSYHAIRKTDVACVFFRAEWCQKVQHSAQSRTMGIPNPYLGLGMLAFILALLVLYQQSVIPFWYPFAVIAGGFAFSVYFLYIQAFVLKAFCTWCVLSFLVFVGLFAVSLRIVL